MEVGVGGERDTVSSGSQAERYQVLLHVGAATLAEGSGEGSEAGSDRSEIEPGIRVSAETSRRLCCDASVVRVTHGSDGSLLDFGRRTRTIPPALRRALEVRDRGCRFPGCSSRFCDAHHIRHWAHGGETSLSNCLLLCRHHHRLVHEGRWSLGLSAQGHPVFRSPRGELVTSYRGEPIGRRKGGRGGKRSPRLEDDSVLPTTHGHPHPAEAEAEAEAAPRPPDPGGDLRHFARGHRRKMGSPCLAAARKVSRHLSRSVKRFGISSGHAADWSSIRWTSGEPRRRRALM